MLFSLNLKAVHSMHLTLLLPFFKCVITKLLYSHVQFKVYGASNFGDVWAGCATTLKIS